jgi:hypothetical protein
MLALNTEIERIKISSSLFKEISPDISNALSDLQTISDEKDTHILVDIRIIAEIICKKILDLKNISTTYRDEKSGLERTATQLYDFIVLLKQKNALSQNGINAIYDIKSAGNLRAHDIEVSKNQILKRVLIEQALQTSIGGLKKLLAVFLDTIERSDLLLQFSEIIKPTYGDSKKDKVPAPVELLNKIRTKTETLIATGYREKYNPEQYLPRSECAEHLTAFLQSTKKLLVLTGKAGSGKSSFVCHFSKSNSSGNVILLIDCSQLKIEEKWNIEKYISTALQIEDFSYIETCLGPELNKKNGKFVLIFDAVNENPQKENLLLQISRLIKPGNKLLKIIITCRLPIWDNIKRHIRIAPEFEYNPVGPGSYVLIENYSAKELPEVYSKYATNFSIQTNYAILSRKLRKLIEQPLFLKLVTETFKGKSIPTDISLSDIFGQYLKKVILFKNPGKEINLTETPEYLFLTELICVFYNYRAAEMNIEDLKSQPGLVRYFENSNTFYNLLDTGLISIKNIQVSFLKEEQVVYFTYERVFEFLLAEIIINPVTTETISEYLSIADHDHYPQLTGAAELKLAFQITKYPRTWVLISELAMSDRSDSRQFLCTVLQTIGESGNKELADNIISKLSKIDNQSVQLVSIQAAFQMNLTERLIDISLSKDEYLRSMSVLFLYQNWEHLRRSGELKAAYEILNRISAHITIAILILPKPKYALQAFISLSLNILMHTVDDPASVFPITNAFKKITDKIPGFKPESRSDGEIRFTMVTNGIIDLLKKRFKPIIIETISDNRDFFTDKKAKRALLDIGGLITVENLEKEKDKILRIITWQHPWVSGSSRSVLIHQVFINYETNFALLKNWLYLENLNIVVQNNILHSLVYGTIARIMNGKHIDPEFTTELIDDFLSIWVLASSASDETIRKYSNKEDFNWLMQNVLFGILYIEGSLYKAHGTIEEDSIALKKILAQDFLPETEKTTFILEAIQKNGFQGNIEYSVRLILNKDFRDIWSGNSLLLEQTYKVLGNLRALYQSEVDGILLETDTLIGHEIKKYSYSMSPEVLSETGYRHWIMVGTATNITLMKMAGIMLVQVVYAENEDQFIDKAVQALLWMFFEPERIDIFHAQYGLAHDPAWDRFEKLEIDRNILHSNEVLNMHYQKKSQEIIHDFNKGILYDDI